MVSVRTAKSKGSSFEYDVQYNLQRWTNKPVTRTSERGFQRQYDIAIGEDINNPDYVIECKRLKGISWNALIKFYKKLESVTPKNATKYIFFQSNHQPCLVFSHDFNGYNVREFENKFSIRFEKHPSTRVKPEVVE